MAEYQYEVGIDLGTTNTLACYFKNGRKNLVKFVNGETMLPSVLYVDKEGKIYVGRKALTRGATDPKNMIRSSKKFIGDYETNMIWNLNGKKFTPTDVATEILKEVKRNFIKAVDCDPDTQIGAVITVPAYFNNNQRNETRKAGEAAGFNVMWILEEPMAAAVEAVRENKIDKKVFVVDIGGGTFDLSVLEADEANHSYNAIALDGDPQLGGDDFDAALVDRFIKVIEDDTGRDFSNPKASGLAESDYYARMNSILTAAQEAKRELSESDETEVDINDIFDDYDFHMDLSREEFDEICQSIYDKIFARTKRFVDNNDRFNRDDIGNIILAGGSCFIPYIQEEIEKMFGREPESDYDKAMLVAYGAAHVAKWKNGGLEGGKAPVIQGIIPHSLGVMAVNDNREQVLSKILEKNTKYPCHNSHKYTTTYDNQTKIDINVYEAGNDHEDKAGIQYHKLYGSLTLDGIAPQPKGVPTFEVTFDYDDNQNLRVTVEDLQTGDSESATIESGKKIELPQESPVDLMLLIDSSGSMCDSMKEAHKASLKFVEEMIDLSTHRMGLISFESSPTLLCHLSHNEDRQLQQKIKQIKPFGGTNMISAFTMAYNELENSPNERIVIMVTDGYPDRRNQTVSYAQNLRTNGLQMYAIGVGEDMDLNFLQQMVGNDNALVIDNMGKLTEAFKTVMQMIASKK